MDPPAGRKRRLLSEALRGTEGADSAATGGSSGGAALVGGGAPAASNAAAATSVPTAAAAAAAAARDNDGSDDDEWGDLAAHAPSDAEAALLALKAELYGDALARAAAKRRKGAGDGGHHHYQQQHQPPPLPPFVLKAQLYTVLRDRTAADRDLDGLARAGRARAFKLATGAGDYALLLASDYSAMVEAAAAHKEAEARALAARARASGTGGATGGATGGGAGGGGSGAGGHGGSLEEAAAAARSAAAAAAALRRFKVRAAPRCHESHVTSERLLQLLATPAPGEPPPPRPSAGASGAGAAASDADLSHLLAAELLSRDPVHPGRLAFTVPGAAAAVRSLVGGRSELLGVLKRKRFGEALEKELLKLRLRRSAFGVRFHLRDLLGRGSVERAETPAGAVIRLVAA